jgi:glucose-1-phosphate cytidylyltransferase
VQSYLGDDDVFLANYGDGISDLPLPAMIEYFTQRNAVACFAGVLPTQSFHLVRIEDGGLVGSIRHVKDLGMRINGGFFAFRREIYSRGQVPWEVWKNGRAAPGVPR